jgi:hypothetical protein
MTRGPWKKLLEVCTLRVTLGTQILWGALILRSRREERIILALKKLLNDLERREDNFGIE